MLTQNGPKIILFNCFIYNISCLDTTGLNYKFLLN